MTDTMGKNCAVPRCISKRRNQDAVHCVHLFSFPTRSKALIRQWMRLIPRKDFQPSKHSRICSLHFSPANLCLVVVQDLHEDEDVTPMGCNDGHTGNLLLSQQNWYKMYYSTYSMTLH